MTLRRCLFTTLLVSSFGGLVACGTEGSSINGPTPPPSGSGQGTPSVPAAPPPSSGTTPTVPPSVTGPRVAIRMRGNTTTFAHADGLSGETPKKQIVAIRSLTLLRSATDPNPVVVFDHGVKDVEADLVTGKVTDLASVVVKTLPAGVFTVAKAGVAYVKYTVDARMHSVVSVDGQYDNVQALSDGVVINGASRDKGYFRYTFGANGTTYGTLTGENAPTPTSSGAGGLSLDMSGPQAFYVFPVQVTLDPNVAEDYEVMLDLNVYESFRWQDQPGPGYAPKVFDTTPATFEPVMAFGANAFTLSVGPAKP